MSAPSSSSHGEGEDDLGEAIASINVTPLVDVMLVLLIIFMVTAPLMLSQVPVTLPKAALQEMGKPRDPLIVSFDLNGNYYIDTGGGHVGRDRDGRLVRRLRLPASNPAFPWTFRL